MSLLDKASLIVTPNAYKESKLYSVVPNTTLGDMDVVRATTATRVNSLGLIEVVPRNLVSYSEDFSNAFWLKINLTVTANSTTAPNGLTTADSLLDNSTNNIHGLTPSITKAATPITYTQSIYAKFKDTDRKIVLSLDDATTGGVDSGVFNLSTGAWDTAISTPSAGFTNASRNFENVGNGWYRLSLTVTSNSGTTIRPNVLLTNSSNAFSYIGNGTGIFVWGAQLEQGSTATEYFPTTTRLNIPRIDYTNGSCPSLLVEPQRTNQYTYSQQFNQWSILGGITVTENDAISPDGTQNADRVQFTGAGNNYLFRTGTGSAGSNTLSVYAKAKSGTSQKFRFFANDGVTISSDQVATNQWQRFTFTYTYSTLNAGIISASTGTSDVLFYGFQAEVGAYPTSYIPTVASTVTRNADVISKSGISSLIGQTEGTLFFEHKGINYNNSTFTKSMSLYENGDNRFLIRYVSQGFINIVFLKSGSALINTEIAITQDAFSKVALKYRSGSVDLFINGVKTNLSTSVTTFVNFSALSLDNTDTTNPFIGLLKSLQLYKTALTDTECINLTTL